MKAFSTYMLGVGVGLIVAGLWGWAIIRPADQQRGYARGYEAAVDSVRAVQGPPKPPMQLESYQFDAASDSVFWSGADGALYGSKRLGPNTIRVTRWHQ